MDNTDLVPPFPPDIDRDAFGHWLSGFTDGEGCFWLGFNSRKKAGRRTPCCRFLIGLREDDSNVLGLIRSYFGVGCFYRTTKRGCRNSTIHFTITTCAHLLQLVVPHFDRFPLRSKKARDFSIWRTAVSFACVRQHRGRGVLHWTDPELNEFGSFVTLLREQRRPPCPTE